jgi:hypothetical protein
VVSAFSEQGTQETVEESLQDVSKLTPGKREKVSQLLGNLITALANKPESDRRVTQALADAT